MNRSIVRDSFDFIARSSLAAVFVITLPKKITEFYFFVDWISGEGFSEPIAKLLLIGAILCTSIGSILFLFGKNRQALGAYLLLIFLIPTTIIFHLFPFEFRSILNLGLIGGLLLSLTRPTHG